MDEHEKKLNRIKALLRKATNNPNENEAKAAWEMAGKMIGKSKLKIDDISFAGARTETTEEKDKQTGNKQDTGENAYQRLIRTIEELLHKSINETDDTARESAFKAIDLMNTYGLTRDNIPFFANDELYAKFSNRFFQNPEEFWNSYQDHTEGKQTHNKQQEPYQKEDDGTKQKQKKSADGPLGKAFDYTIFRPAILLLYLLIYPLIGIPGRFGRLTFIIIAATSFGIWQLAPLAPESIQFWIKAYSTIAGISGSIGRLHDLDRKWYYCIGLSIPIYNVYLLAQMVLFKGSEEANEYGITDALNPVSLLIKEKPQSQSSGEKNI